MRTIIWPADGDDMDGHSRSCRKALIKGYVVAGRVNFQAHGPVNTRQLRL